MREKGGSVHTRKRNKILKKAKGYFGSRHRLYKTAKESVLRAEWYAFNGRKERKQDFRKLWIRRISAACKINNTSYSKFMFGLKQANIELNRKMLSELASSNPSEFAKLVEKANQAASKVSK